MGVALAAYGSAHRTFSSAACFATNFFGPYPGKVTVSFASSPAPSHLVTTPLPYLSCRTRSPTLKSPASFVVDGDCGSERPLRCEAPFRLLKNSWTLSTEL